MVSINAIERIAADIKSLRDEFCSKGLLTCIDKSDNDFLTNKDITLETKIRAILKNITPEIPVVGEEFGGVKSDVFWSVDPIDGTINYTRGIDIAAITVTLIDLKTPTISFIYFPFFDTLYTAVKGRGAFRDGIPIKVSDDTMPGKNIISVGDFGLNKMDSNDEIQTFCNIARTAAMRVKMFGSAAYDMACIAEGSVDAGITFGNKLWDTQGGGLLVREAGGVVVDADGSEHNTESTITIAGSKRGVASLIDCLSEGIKNNT